MAWMMGEVRLKRVSQEDFHQAGQKVWLLGEKVTVKRRKGNYFGVVVKDSIWPDLWVTVDVRNKEQFVDLENPKNQRRAKCPMRLR